MALQLRVYIPESLYCKTHIFDGSTTVGRVKHWALTSLPMDADPSGTGSGLIRSEWTAQQAAQYGVFACNAASMSNGTWLEEGRTLGSYGLRNKDILKVMQREKEQVSAPPTHQKLRVVVPALRRQKMMTFALNETVGQVKKEIVASSKILKKEFGTGCGLFIPYEDAVDDGIWMDEERVLSSYHLKDGDAVELKLNLKALDSQKLTLNIDIPSMNVVRPLVLDGEATVAQAKATIMTTFHPPLKGETVDNFGLYVAPGLRGEGTVLMQESQLLKEYRLLDQDIVLFKVKPRDVSSDRKGDSGRKKTTRRLTRLFGGRGDPVYEAVNVNDPDESPVKAKPRSKSKSVPGKDDTRPAESDQRRMVKRKPKKAPQALPLPAVPPGQPLLVLRCQDIGPLAGQEFRVGVTGAKIGRSRTFQNHIVIPGSVTHVEGDDTVSREHCSIYFHSGQFYVRNLNKKNITSIRLAGSSHSDALLRLEGLSHRHLSSGDWVYIGSKTIMEVEVSGTPVAELAEEADEIAERDEGNMIQLEDGEPPMVEAHVDEFDELLAERFGEGKMDTKEQPQQEDVFDGNAPEFRAPQEFATALPVPFAGGQPEQQVHGYSQPEQQVHGYSQPEQQVHGYSQPEDDLYQQPYQQQPKIQGYENVQAKEDDYFAGCGGQTPGEMPVLPQPPSQQQEQADFATLPYGSQGLGLTPAQLKAMMTLMSMRTETAPDMQSKTILVYNKAVEDENLLGEVILEPHMSIADVHSMIREELLEEGERREFSLKKNKVPINKRQFTKDALKFFHGANDVVVIRFAESFKTSTPRTTATTGSRVPLFSDQSTVQPEEPSKERTTGEESEKESKEIVNETVEEIVGNAVEGVESLEQSEDVKPVEEEEEAEDVKPVEKEEAAEDVKPVEKEEAAEDVKPVEEEEAEDVKPVEEEEAEDVKPVEEEEEKNETHDKMMDEAMKTAFADLDGLL